MRVGLEWGFLEGGTPFDYRRGLTVILSNHAGSRWAEIGNRWRRDCRRSHPPPFSWSILNYAIRWCDTPPLPPPVLQNLAFSPRDAWILLNLPLASCTRVWTFLLVVAMDFNCIVIASLHVLRYITMIFFDDTIVEGSISFPETEGLIVDGMHF